MRPFLQTLYIHIIWEACFPLFPSGKKNILTTCLLQLVYQLDEEWPSVGAFEVEPSTGKVMVRTPLDRESQASFVLVVKAQDQPSSGAPLAARVTCYISIEDVNDHSPTFASTAEATIAPDAPVGAILQQLIAIDLDAGENGHVSYHIANGNDVGYFSLDHNTGASLSWCYCMVFIAYGGDFLICFSACQVRVSSVQKPANIKACLWAISPFQFFLNESANITWGSKCCESNMGCYYIAYKYF